MIVRKTLLAGFTIALAVAFAGCNKSSSADSGSSGDSPKAPAPAGYQVINSTDFGQVLSTDKPKATDVQNALESTLPDLAQYFGQRPKVGGAYEDTKTQKSGSAAFTATRNGHAVKGMISCKMVDHGATINVMYCRTDAPADALAKLTAPPAAPAAAANPLAANPLAANNDAPALHNYDFPDGTGSIGLADGWTTKAQSVVTPISIVGPDEEMINLGNSFSVNAPDSQAVKMVEQNEARAKQMGMQPMPRQPNFFIAEFSDPATAIAVLWPQMSKANEAAGGPAIHLDKIISQTPIKTNLPNAKAADIVFDVTRTKDGKSSQYRNHIAFQMSPVMGGSWMMLMRGFSTPVDKYDQESPKIVAMITSMKVNQEVATKVLGQMLQAQNQFGDAMRKQMADASAAQMAESNRQFQISQNQRAADHQAYMDRTQAGYDAHNQQFRDDQLQKSRNNADQVEMIRGYRTVVDTQTGKSANADYYNVNEIVDTLNANANDPGRFKQIPLRDELYPEVGK